MDGGVKALQFYKKAFGAKEITKERKMTPDGKVIHASFMIGDSLIMLSDGFARKSQADSGQLFLHIYSKSVDKLWKDALAADREGRGAPKDMYWGERYGLSSPIPSETGGQSRCQST